MDVYDFDGTLCEGDSTANFVKWCAKRYPRVALTLPRAGIMAFACYKLHVIDKTTFKSHLYRFLRHIPDIECEVKRFWKANAVNFGGPCTPKAGDLVISAGPEFLLRNVCMQRGLQLIASRVDPHTGRVLGPNCSGEEKVVRYRERFGCTAIEHFYSDSRNDDPLAAIADEAWLVDIPRNTLTSWPKLR